MPSLSALKLGVAALIGLGAADLAWINLALGPRALGTDGRAGEVDPLATVVASNADAAKPEASKPGAPAVVASKTEASKPEASKTDAPAVVASKTDASKADASKTEPRTGSSKPDASPAEPAAASADPPASAPIYFESMSRRVSTTGRGLLVDVAKRAGANAIVHLEGHTDYRGGEGYNEELSKRRVETAAAVLIKHGIEASRIKRVYAGKRGASEGPEAELWRDRRVDVWIEGGTE